MTDSVHNPIQKPILPLSLIMPLALLVFVAGATWWGFHLGQEQASKSVRNEAMRDLKWTATRLEVMFERAYRLSDNQTIQEEVAGLGSNREFIFAVITDESHKVLHSMRLAEIGKPLKQVLPAFYRDTLLVQEDSLAKIAARKGGQVQATEDGRTIIATYPIILGTQTGELRPNRVGRLVLISDYSSRQAVAFQAVTQEALSFFALTSLVAVGLGLFFHFAIARRLRRLALVAHEVGSGNMGIRSELGGHDEVAFLARSVDQMVADKAAADIQLRESEEKYRGLVESTHDLVQSVSPDGSFIFVNPEWKKVLGYEDEDLQQLTVFDVVHPDSLEHCQTLFHQVMSGQAVPRLEATFVAKDGHSVVVEGNVTPRLLAGKVIATHGFFRDITQRKEEQAELLERQSRLQAILLTAVEGIITIDELGQIESLNPAAEKLFGYTAAELAGQNVKMLMPSPYHEEHDGYLSRYRETGEKKIIGIGREVVGKRKDGTTFPMELAVGEVKFGNKTIFTGFVRDLTERRRSEELEQNLGRILEESLNEIFVCSAETMRFVLVNRGARENTGYTMAELRELTPLDIEPEFTPEALEQLVKPLRAGEQQKFVIETVHRRKDGTFYDAEVHVQLSKYQGRPAFVAIVVDITDRKRAERTLRLQGQALDTGATAITFADLDGKLTYFNRAFVEMWGYDENDDLIGTPIVELSSSHEDAQEVIDGLYDRGEWIGERLAKRKDGSLFDIQISASIVFGEHGKPIAMMASFVDISDMKRIEADLRVRQRAVDSAANGILITDPTQQDNPIVYVNHAMQKITGYTAAEVLGRNCRFLQKDDQAQEGLRELRAAIKEERECKVVLKNYRKNGTVFWNELTVSPVRDEKGKLTHFVGIQSDITERTEAAVALDLLNEELELRVEERTHQLQETQKQLVRREKLATLGQLAGSVAHEIRNPLAIIKNAVYFLNGHDNHADQDVREAFDEIDRALYSSNRIVSELLDFARDPKSEIISFSPNEVVAQALSAVPIPDNIVVQWDDASLPFSLRGDPGQIERVLINLIQNAVQAMPKGGTLTINCRLISDSKAEIVVKDTGCGISQDELGKVFEPLYSRRAKGFGLGLALCKRYAELNQGKLRVESEQERSTIFRLELGSVPEIVGK